MSMVADPLLRKALAFLLVASILISISRALSNLLILIVHLLVRQPPTLKG